MGVNSDLTGGGAPWSGGRALEVSGCSRYLNGTNPHFNSGDRILKGGPLQSVSLSRRAAAF